MLKLIARIWNKLARTTPKDLCHCFTCPVGTTKVSVICFGSWTVAVTCLWRGTTCVTCLVCTTKATVLCAYFQQFWSRANLAVFVDCFDYFLRLNNRACRHPWLHYSFCYLAWNHGSISATTLHPQDTQKYGLRATIQNKLKLEHPNKKTSFSWSTFREYEADS